jgi:HSP20 family protein
MRADWSPIRDILQRHARFGRAIGEPAARSWGGPSRRRRSMPHLDVSESHDAFIVRIDLPGVTREAVSVAVAAGNLEIKGELPAPPAGDDGQVLRAERPNGPFHRVVPLPRQADTDSISASISEGVLTITVQKRAPDTGRTVAVE